MTWEELEAEYQGMYERMETNDEGDITIRTVVEHIKGVEAGSGNNNWVKFYSYVCSACFHDHILAELDIS